MDNIWTILELEPTKDIPAIRNAFAWKDETCKQEDYPLLLQAYQAALDQAKTQEDASSKNKQTFGDMDARLLANQSWTFSPNPYAHSPAIQKFLDLYTGKQRKNAKNSLSEETCAELTATTKRRKLTERDHSIRTRLARAKEQAKQPTVSEGKKHRTHSKGKGDMAL
jgi:hypothetical protein